ncbi:MAG: hypothetical protein JXX29_06635 [Deltaproteobacteria bacterium]|nr:hypothetical protein [Deltaproteobacteria bacterium]MBN2671328.1 hypothetical protein [Deltaproteobacteria bacterium]
MKTVVCCGFVCCDVMGTAERYPEENQKQFVQSMEISAGGPATNAACLLARWGVNTYLAGQLGRDAFADLVMSDLQRAGVRLDMLQRYDGPSDCAMIISSQQSGSRTVLSRRYSDSYECRAVSCSTRADGLLLDGHQYEWGVHLLRGFTGISVLDAGSMRDATVSLLSQVTDPVVSARFYEQVSGEHPPRELARILPKRLIVTRGEQSVLELQRGSQREHSVFSVPVVDTLAAGDVFHGAYLFGRLYGLSRAQSIRLGAAASALCVGRRGGYHAIPSFAETVAFLQSQQDPVADTIWQRCAEDSKSEVE